MKKPRKVALKLRQALLGDVAVYSFCLTACWLQSGDVPFGFHLLSNILFYEAGYAVADFDFNPSILFVLHVSHGAEYLFVCEAFGVAIFVHTSLHLVPAGLSCLARRLPAGESSLARERDAVLSSLPRLVLAWLSSVRVRDDAGCPSVALPSIAGMFGLQPV